MVGSTRTLILAPFVALLFVACGQPEQESPQRRAAKKKNTTTSHESGDSIIDDGLFPSNSNNFPTGGTTTGGTTNTGGSTSTGDETNTGGSTNSGGSTDTGGGSQQPTGNLTWKAVLMTGDDSINAFDNARKKIGQLLQNRGIKAENIKHLSDMKSQQTGGVMVSNKANFESALKSLTANDPNAACFIHMTSHGSKQGFILGSQTILPADMHRIVDAGCGDRPTVLLISSCYSGVHLTTTSKTKNRIILTAARPDRTSFGCSAEETYVFWDTCFIDLFPKAQNWSSLANDIQSCIEKKESGGKYTPSEPQKFFGSEMTNATVFSTTKLMDYYDTI